MNLCHAQKLAVKIVSELIPFCDKIEIAGSIRRERSNVNDIDIVLIPQPGAIQKITERCARNMKLHVGRRPDPKNVTFLGNGFQLDLFFAHGQIDDLVSSVPSNFGAVFLCRTGSLEHNRKFCELALNKGLRFAPYRGIVKRLSSIRRPGVCLDGSFGDEIIASETEEEVYAALGLPWREPRERETLKT